MTFGSLFSGIGGLDLGLERAGMRCRWQVDTDPFCLKVLTKHWPHVPKYGDIRELTGEELERVDCIAGGFPCQDISPSGKRVGIEGSRSGLWADFARLVSILRPQFVLVENSADLLYRGIGRVLGDLAFIGYDAEWEIISACAFGAPHARERMFLVAYPESSQRWPISAERRDLDDPDVRLFQRKEMPGRAKERCQTLDRGEWSREPAVGRVAYGVAARMDRLSGIGNAVVPQVAQWLGERIMEAAGELPQVR